MEITQIDSKTIRLVKNGFTFFLRYCFFWDKLLRTPESIALDNTVVKAFFLTSVIQDAITEDEKGFYISRSWNIVPGGEISLFFTIDLQAAKNIPYFFPCILTEDRVPQQQVMISGERLTYPSGVFLYIDGKSIFIGLDVPARGDEQGSIGVSRTNLDGIASIRTEITFPSRELLPKGIASIPGFVPGPESQNYQSEGNLKKTMQLNVLMALEKEIFPVTTSFFLKKYKDTDLSNPALSKGNALKLIKEGVDVCITDLIVEKGGAYGPAITDKTDSISSLVCAGLAYLIQRVYENNYDMNETSFRLADFCLKSQHPTGVFFEYFHPQSGTWSNDPVPPPMLKLTSNTFEHIVVRIEHSAAIADYFLSVAIIQKAKELSGEKYFSAGKRFIELFFDTKKKGLIDLGSTFVLDTLEPKNKSRLCLNLIPPLIKLYKITGEDKYKKAVAAIKAEFFAESFSYTSLPSCSESESPDFATALLLLKSAISFEEIGIKVKDKEVFVNMALPWVYINKSQEDRLGDAEPFTSGMLDSFDRCRIVYRGFELAYYLLKINEMLEKKPLSKLIRNVASYLIDSGSKIRLGTEWFHHSLYNNEPKEKNVRPVTGPFDTRTFIREASYLLKLVNHFPDMIR
jgi:hypothetical protein